MILTRTPFRISFAGGGSDLKSYYSVNTGSVLSVTIKKYIYIAIHPFFNNKKIQLKYSTTELVDSLDQIKHPIFKEVINLENINGVDISSIADIPAGTGLGSSSSFTVGLLNAINAYKGQFLTKKEMAEKACEIEIERLSNPIGKQDQYAAAYGGINNIKFYSDESVEVTKVKISEDKTKELEGNLLMVFTGGVRDASSILTQQSQMMSNKKKKDSVGKMVDLSFKLQNVIESNESIDDFGFYLNQGWELKRSLIQNISNPVIDNIYKNGIAAGALGGKLLGAGNGGFILFYCQKKMQAEFKNRMKNYLIMDVEFDLCGSKIVYQDQKF